MPTTRPEPQYVKPMVVSGAEILTFAYPDDPDKLFIRRETIDDLVRYGSHTVRWYYIGGKGEEPTAEPISGEGQRFTARNERDEWWRLLLN